MTRLLTDTSNDTDQSSAVISPRLKSKKPNRHSEDVKESVNESVPVKSEEKEVSRSKSEEAASAKTEAAVEDAGKMKVKEEVVGGRERIKRHRVEVAGRVWIPEIWGQEELLKDWVDCSGFEASLMNNSIVLARSALVQQGRRADSDRLRLESSC